MIRNQKKSRGLIDTVEGNHSLSGEQPKEVPSVSSTFLMRLNGKVQRENTKRGCVSSEFAGRESRFGMRNCQRIDWEKAGARILGIYCDGRELMRGQRRKLPRGKTIESKSQGEK